MDALNLEERPRERCLQSGAQALSLRECVAVLLGAGIRGKSALALATEVVDRSSAGMQGYEQSCGFFTGLEGQGSEHLQSITGLGTAQRARLLAAFELARRYARFKFEAEPLARDPRRRSLRLADRLPQQALNAVPARLRHETQEWLGFVPFHRNGKVGEFCLVEKGVRTHVTVDPAELFARILSLRPKGFFLFHNHPSGSLDPSPEDGDLTERVEDLARKLGIIALGHGIVTARSERWIVRGGS